MGQAKWLFGLLIWGGLLHAADYQVTIQGVTYTITKKLGAGAVGTVYLGTDPSGKKVAIKVLSADVEREMAAIQRRQELEKTQAKGKTVGIVAGGKVERFQTATLDNPDGVEFRSVMANAQGAIVMDKVDGTLNDIAPWFRLGGSSGQVYSFKGPELGARVDHAFSLAVEMGDLWSGLVEKGYLYTDFKPINVGFDGQPPKVKLLDLGSLTTGPIDSNSPIDVRNLLVGTSDFRPPEMLKIKGETPVPGQVYNHYSDYFAIGRTLLQLYCGLCNPDQFEEIVLSYAKKFPGPEHRADIAKMVFLSEFIKASQHRELSAREAAISGSPILSKYFDLSRKAGPRAVLSQAQVLHVSNEVVPTALKAMEGRVLARQAGWSPQELRVTNLLALPGEEFPAPDVSPRARRADCNSQYRLLPFVVGSLLVGTYGGWMLTKEPARPKDPPPKREDPPKTPASAPFRPGKAGDS